MKLNRKYITPFIACIFLVVGITGLLMLFHIFDGYTEVVHECFGLVFTVCAILHIAVNWKALKFHFGKKVMFPALASILLVSVTFSVFEALYPPIDLLIINKIIQAPLTDAFNALGIDYNQALERLEQSGISTRDATTLEDLWLQNNADPEEIIDMVLQQ